MVNKLRQKAIEGYCKRDDGVDWKGLMDYANTMFDARDALIVSPKDYDVDPQEARKLFAAHTSYLSAHPYPINPEELRKSLKEIRQSFIDKGIVSEPSQVEALKNIDWDKLSDETLKLAGKNPSAFFEQAYNELLSSGDTQEVETVLAGLFLNLLRVYLKDAGEQVTAALENLDEVATDDRPLLCPTCGSIPSISSVAESEGSQSNERKLFCSCCGTVWPFERIRCAVCGNTNSNKLKYVYADEDKAHRLHLCEECGHATPTVFQNSLNGALDYDVELVAVGVVQNIFERLIEEENNKQA